MVVLGGTRETILIQREVLAAGSRIVVSDTQGLQNQTVHRHPIRGVGCRERECRQRFSVAVPYVADSMS